MEITIEQIKELRDRTGAGVNAVREALSSSEGDTDKAIQYLREKGLAKSAKRAGREASNGILGTYIHHDQRLVVVIEVATETDFAAKSEDLKQFAKDLSLHLAAKSPKYANIDQVPAEIMEQERAIASKDTEGKPAEIAEKIIQGRLDSFFADNVLLNQQLFSDETKTVGDYLNEIVAKIGEKIEINRFVIFKIGSHPITTGI